MIIGIRFSFYAFRRKKLRGAEKTWLIVSLRRWGCVSVWGLSAKFRLLCRLSERFVCIRRIATPFSSVEKSKPRCIERCPVDMSVLLPERPSLIGWESDATLSVRPYIDVGRDLLKTVKGLHVWGSRVRSLLGSILLMYRRISTSSGRKPNFHALKIYRGNSARRTVRGRQSQK